MLAYITGTVDQEVLLRNEYLAKNLQALGRKALAEVALAARPGTLLRGTEN